MANGGRSTLRVPRIFVDDPGAADAGIVNIHGSVVHRLSRVLRLRRGDRVEIIHAETFFETVLLRVGRDAAEAEIVSSRAVQAEPPPWVTICPSVIRAQRFDLLIEKVTELGIDEIRPVRAARSLANSKSMERLGRWRRLITEASEQCRREQRPEVQEPHEVLDLIAEPGLPDTIRLFASAREREQTIDEVITNRPWPAVVQILVGPEGGFTDEEARAAVGAGWIPATLGPRPLRAETAGIVAVAVTQAALAKVTQPAN
jgi:16S rRNA (uracil1498-N3)-methyltransferase